MQSQWYIAQMASRLNDFAISFDAGMQPGRKASCTSIT